ncbi:hypothetical protein GCM10019017_43450 [Streptomyces showdoensis]
MIRAADIRERRNQDVVDPGDHGIGELESVYVDTSTDEPAMATVRAGLPTRQRPVSVLLEGATAGPVRAGRPRRETTGHVGSGPVLRAAPRRPV